MSTETNGLGSGRFEYGGAGVDQFQRCERIEVYSASGRFVGYAFKLQGQDQTDPTPTIPESTQPKQDLDEKNLFDLNEGNMPKIAERKLHLIVGTREEFNSSMQNNLTYLDGLIEGDGQNLKLDDSAANDLKAKVGELKQKIQDNPKMGRHKIYKKYNELKQEIVKSQNEKCCDKVLNDLRLDKSNLPNGVQQVYNKALSSKEPVDGEKFKKAAIKAHNKDVVDDIKKEIDDGKISSRNIAQKMKIKHFVSGALKQERLVSKDELKENLDSKFSGSTGVGAEGIAGDDENANAVGENTNKDDNTNDLIDAIYNEPENDEFNANGNLLLNGAGASENNDVFIQNMNDGFGDNNEVSGDVQPETTLDKGISGDDTSAVGNLDGEGEQVESTDEPGAEETTNPEDTGAAKATDSKETTSTDAAADPYFDDFEEIYAITGEDPNDFDPNDDTNFLLNTDDDDSTSAVGGQNNGDLETDFSNKKNFESSFMSKNAIDSSGNKTVDTDKSVKKQKGQRQKEFISKAFEKFEGQPELKDALSNKLNKLNGKYYRLAFNTRANWMIGRANKLKSEFEKIDKLVSEGKINKKKADTFKEKYAKRFLDGAANNEQEEATKGIKSGVAHSLKFNAELRKLSHRVDKRIAKREAGAYKAMGKLMSQIGVENVLTKFDAIKERFLGTMANRGISDEDSKEDKKSATSVTNDEITKTYGDIFDANMSVLKPINIADENLKSLLGDRLGYLLQKYGNDEKEFTARAQRMIDRAQKIENAINEINEGINVKNFTPTTQDSYGSNTEKKTISDENKQRLLDLLKIETSKRSESKFNASLESLKKEILDKEIAEKAANENVDDDQIWTCDDNNDRTEDLDDPMWYLSDMKKGNNDIGEDPLWKDFEESLGM